MREIAGRNVDVAVVDEEIFVTCMGYELDDIADLSVGAELFGRVNEMDAAIGEFRLQALYGCTTGAATAGSSSEETPKRISYSPG